MAHALLRGLSYRDLLMYLLPKLEGLGDSLERFLRAARSRNYNRSIISGSSDETLVDSDTLNLGQQDFYRAMT